MNKSEGQVLDFEKICRLCLLEKRSMSSIFAKKKSDKKVPLPVRIMSCASLELYEGDGLPASICSKCLLSVNQSYAFREQCEQADTTLRQYAQRMTEATGETSSNREPRELIANHSLTHISDFGIKIEEGHGVEDEDFEQGVGNLDLQVKNSTQNLKDNSQLSFKKSNPPEEISVKGGNKSDCYKEKKSLTEKSFSFKNTLGVDREGKCDLKSSGIKEGQEHLKQKIKIISEANNDDVNVNFASEQLKSIESPVMKTLSEKKAENLVVVADVSSVLEDDEDCDFGESGTEDDSSSRIEKRKLPEGIKTKKSDNLSLQLHAARKARSRPKKSSFENKRHLELLQNLMKNKNIIVKRRDTYLSTQFLTGTNQEFKSNFRCIKGLSFPYGFKIAQLWKEWEKINKRFPNVSEINADTQVDSETGPKAVPEKVCSFIHSEISRELTAEDNVEEETNIQSPKGKCKNAKDIVYCKECGIFLLRSSYGNHIKFVHKKIRKYLCQTCGYAACTGTILRQHVQAVHVGYSFFCDQCPRKFNLMKRLRKHIELHHSGKPVERNHICQYCGMAFVKPSCLKRHLRSHTQETPYQCQYCQRRFKYRWPKKQHERLHTGEKPYKCSYCEERFTQNCVRKAHEYKVHGNEEFKPKTRAKEGKAANRDNFRTEREESEVSFNSDAESS